MLAVLFSFFTTFHYPQNDMEIEACRGAGLVLKTSQPDPRYFVMDGECSIKILSGYDKDGANYSVVPQAINTKTKHMIWDAYLVQVPCKTCQYGIVMIDTETRAKLLKDKKNLE